MYAELKKVIERKSDSPPVSLGGGGAAPPTSSTTSSINANVGPASTALDTVQLTSILSACGFHLDHFDIDRTRRVSSSSTANANGGAAASTGDVCVEITCQRSGIVSRMHHTPVACTCPDEAECTARSAIWDVQSAGGPKSGQHSLNGGTSGGGGGWSTNGGRRSNGCEAMSVTSSSNLLPQLSPRKVQVTKHLVRVMLEVFEAKDENGNAKIPNASAANESTAKSPLPKNGLQPHEHPTAELFHTPLSSINVTPMTPSDFVAGVVGLPKMLLNGNNDASSTMSTMHGSQMQQQNPSNANGLENMSVATFGSPNSDMFTSSPHHARMWTADQRDQVLTSLRLIRKNIDHTMAMLDFDSTRNITTDQPTNIAATASATAAAATATAATRTPNQPSTAATQTAAAPRQKPTQMPNGQARRHSLSVLPTAQNGGAVGRATNAPIKSLITRRLAPIQAAGRVSTGSTTASLRRPLNVTPSSSAAPPVRPASGTPRVLSAGGASSRPTGAGLKHTNPTTRITLVQRNSMSSSTVAVGAAAGAALARSAAANASTLTRSAVTRSLTRLPTSAAAAAAAAAASSRPAASSSTSSSSTQLAAATSTSSLKSSSATSANGVVGDAKATPPAMATIAPMCGAPATETTTAEATTQGGD